MYNDTVEVPVVIRAPMGGRRGYGPTHSQTLEKHFIGVPGLRVVAPCALGDPGQLLAETIANNDQPLLFVENKLLYLKKVADEEALSDFVVNTIQTRNASTSTYKLALKGAPTATLTLAAYGYMAELAREAALRLAYEKEIFVELIVPTQLSPVEITPVLESLRRTRRLLTVEEGTLTLGWGAEMIANAKENLGATLLDARRVAAQDSPVPASVPLETAMLPQVETIFQTAIKMV
jgi:pyruvate/2-oxoglutarate/acetoin dehydrogenase E1 component